MKVIILAAGVGRRLGATEPKPLTIVDNNNSILDYQLKNIQEVIGAVQIILVVGYEKEKIREKFPDLTYIDNAIYYKTNTAKSLLYALNTIQNEDVLWMNGDVFFDGEILISLRNSVISTCLVKESICGDEEIKYTLDKDGFIQKLSKEVKDARGEAIGINLIKKEDLVLFKKALQKVNDDDYFEKALENLTLAKKLKLGVVNIGNSFAEDIDFPEDLEKVKQYIQSLKREQ